MRTGSIQAEDDLLEGHLCLTRELVSFLGQAKKFEVGADVTKNINLIKVMFVLLHLFLPLLLSPFYL